MVLRCASQHYPDHQGWCCSISTNLVEYLTSPNILNFDLVTGNNTVSNEPALSSSPRPLETPANLHVRTQLLRHLT